MPMKAKASKRVCTVRFPADLRKVRNTAISLLTIIDEDTSEILAITVHRSPSEARVNQALTEESAQQVDRLASRGKMPLACCISRM